MELIVLYLHQKTEKIPIRVVGLKNVSAQMKSPTPPPQRKRLSQPHKIMQILSHVFNYPFIIMNLGKIWVVGLPRSEKWAFFIEFP